MTRTKSSNLRYAGERITNLVRFGGLETRFVEWYNPKVGPKREVACAFQVKVAEEWHTVSRYDSDHGTFHRHEAAWPEAKARDYSFGKVPMGERGATALEDVKNNIEQFLKKIPREVLDNEASG